jgi:hypothetical protein
MKDIDPDQLVMGDKSGIDLSDSRPSLKALLKQQQEQFAQLPDDTDAIERARLQLDIAETLLGLQQKQDSWDTARETFDVFVATEQWQDAIEACNVLFQCEHDESLAALGNGVWLSVTYPIPAQLTVAMLQHIVDETPDDSDGGPVAAMVAHYIADLRTEGKEHESLTFFTNQMIAGVAKRHRGIDNDPEMIRMWTEILGLNDVPELLARLGEMLNLIVGDNWWVDRDALRARLPVN